MAPFQKKIKNIFKNNVLDDEIITFHNLIFFLLIGYNVVDLSFP